LLRYVVFNFEIVLKHTDAKLDVLVYYYHLTELGFSFVNACSRPRVVELEKVDAVSRAKNVRDKHPF